MSEQIKVGDLVLYQSDKTVVIGVVHSIETRDPNDTYPYWVDANCNDLIQLPREGTTLYVPEQQTNVQGEPKKLKVLLRVFEALMNNIDNISEPNKLSLTEIIATANDGADELIKLAHEVKG